MGVCDYAVRDASPRCRTEEEGIEVLLTVFGCCNLEEEDDFTTEGFVVAFFTPAALLALSRATSLKA